MITAMAKAGTIWLGNILMGSMRSDRLPKASQAVSSALVLVSSGMQYGRNRKGDQCDRFQHKCTSTEWH
ncbi:hypothetical protein [Nostoc sp.]